jgi:hypothetical protein
VFTKNRDRLLAGVVADEFFSLVVNQARDKRLLREEHFTVDGTLGEAWAGQKSFQARKRPNNGRPTGHGGSSPGQERRPDCATALLPDVPD